MLLEGQLFKQYRIVHQLQSGGMGEVYLANDVHLHRKVAIKVIRNDASRYADVDALNDAVRLFLREAQAIAQLDHNHILPLYGVDEESINGIPHMYMVMPFRREGSLADWLHKHNQRILSPWDVERIVTQAASALQHAHNHQIIHQDVKPSNFLIQTDTEPEQPSRLHLQLADFGVAKLMTTTSESQTIRGTPDYMAPEQWEGRAVPATDQYALAVMAYELLTGYLPFEGSSHQQMWLQHRYAEAHPPSTINPNIPKEIDDVLLHALAKNPKDRFGSIEIFARAFRQALLNSGNVQRTVTISAWEAQKGTRRVIILPGRRRVAVNVPAGVHHGQIMRLEGRGVPSKNGGPAGALILIIAVADVPDVVTVAFTRTSTVDAIEPPPNVYNDEQFDKQPKKGLRGGVILKVALAMLLIAISISAFLITQAHQQKSGKTTPVNAINGTHTAAYTSTVITNNTVNAQTHVTATTQANATATAQANATATTQAIAAATAQANATATTQAIATATAQANINATATVKALIENYRSTVTTGNLVLNDGLKVSSQDTNWDTGNAAIAGDGSCAYAGGSYHSIPPQTGSFAPCFNPSSNFSNFSYEVHLMVVQGDQGGIIFRANKANGTFYYFHIDRKGSFALEKYDHFILTGVLKNGSSPSILTDLNQTNLIAIVAIGNTTSMFVNMRSIARVTDSTYNQGQIGVIGQNINNPTDVAFTDAKVWSR